MGKRGPKTGFNEKVRETFLRLLKEGKTEAEIAEIVGVSRRTLCNWKGKHQDLLLAVNEAKLTADQLVAASLYQRALGYSHPEEKIFCSEGQIITHDTVKHYPPDTTAAMFWLRNRQPNKWKEKTEGDVNVKTVVNTSGMTDEELDAKIAEKLAKQEKK